VLTIENLRKSYGGPAVLDGVDLAVAPGQVLGLLGANGAGKTTLISIATGLRSADGGSVRVAGIDALHRPRAAAWHIGLAPQDLGVYPTLTVAGNLMAFGRLSGLRGGRLRRRVSEVSEALGLTHQLPTTASRLSGGQRRRLHTAAALLHEPDLLFLDEPTVGADVQARADILAVVRSMAAGGTAIVYTTHYLSELEQLGADIAVLNNGTIVVSGSLDEVLRRYATTAVALCFSGPVPALEGWRAAGQRLIPISQPADAGAAASGAIAALGDRAGGLTGVEITRPSLETAYLTITGERFAAATTPEVDHALVA